MQERSEAAKAYVLFRGQYDQRREQVDPGTFACLPPMPAELPKNRLGLARWLMRPENPLVARVVVNRFWQEVMGTGIVRTPGDFGAAGEMPTHPELLDWLAVEFRESGWDVKKFFRLLAHFGHVSPVGRGHGGEAGEGSAEPASSPAVRGFAWTPRWFATMPWQQADCWCERSAGRA